MTALAGDDEEPAIQGFDPDVGAELYTTNGDTNDHMYARHQTISFTPEGTGAASGSGFVFQDVEADVQEEFEKHVQFALDLARSADDPSRPDSHLGNEAPNFVVDDFSVVVRRSADRAGERTPRPRPDPAAGTGSTAARCAAARRASGPAASATATRATTGTTACAAR